MNARAKVFMNGRSQAIRLPREFRVTGGEVLLKRVPEGILITERDPWDACEEACRELSDSFFRVMEKRNRGLKLEQRAWRDEA
jgi:antitoxin VapB